MERTSKLADLKLVSKYYPVANYSYPQPDRRSHNGHSQSRGSNASSRASLGSDGSVPGLIDDRTDSEVSLDDDYQYHTHATELWDSFWKPGTEAKSPEPELQPRKQYPALIPSPQQRKRLGLEERRIPAWPLPEGPLPRSRRAAATYSPFPKLIPLPPRTSSLVPSWQCSRSKQPPQRPPRPDENLIEKFLEKSQVELVRSTQVEIIEPPRVEVVEQPQEEVVEKPHEDAIKCTEIEIVTPSSQLSSPVLSHFATSPEAYKTNFSRPVTPVDHHPKTSLDIRPTSSLERHLSIYLTSSQSASNLSQLDSQPITHAMASKKSAPSLQSITRASDPEPQLLSVFEYDDSDSESESEDSRALSFFRFHKRGSSDSRRASKSSESGHRRRRTNGGTVPSSPTQDRPDRLSKDWVAGRKRQGGDVLGRMLGRRSR
ncbi:hypothetical protein BGZ61DRAFT_491944 [Ilyonectria robusta]|uniref:uncharacterized protein n=1 Tax=Ilyonectria robusta TaxID=1079257 RepID=UPI001E8D2689|nr:uncharacterized protein BGZ61DRAFT_491944 [Ilyonectria robusta]KAH8729713.1 hypothetical protein BGZ61DRAFT_491944 [Ilyonectria robusta]